MAKATTTITFADGDQVTSAKLTQIISGFSLGADSVDASTMTLNSGVLSVGVLGSGNYGADSIPEAAFKAASIPALAYKTATIPAAALIDDSIPATKFTATVSWGKLLPADKAVQADMQSETADHFVSPSVLKYHPGVVKAYGTVSIESGVVTVTGGYNVTSAADTGTGRQITLAVTMANTNYTVAASYKDGSAVANSVGWSIDSTTKFTLQAGAEAAARGISFFVYGQLA